MDLVFEPHIQEFAVQVRDRVVTARLCEPPTDYLASSPALLLTLASDRHSALTVHPYSMGTQTFLAVGHRVVSFDLPHHGERVGSYGQGIDGFRNAYVAGEDPFKQLIEDGRAVIDHCQTLGVAPAGRIVIDGTSRGGYMALRLMAADQRFIAGSLNAPVTDWRYLREFAADRDRPDLDDLRLDRYADALVGRPVYMAIGHLDERVSTPSCCRLYLALYEANQRHGTGVDKVMFFCTPDEGHTLGDEWRQRGLDFLLAQL